MKTYKVTVDCNRTIRWYKEGTSILHREDGPATEDVNGGAKLWYQNGNLHRVDGPAIIWSNGSKEWWIEGKHNRLDGPATESFNGDKFWRQNDALHRADGPAIEYANGEKRWYINGVNWSEKQFNEMMNPFSCEGKVVEIEGKKYKLVSL